MDLLAIGINHTSAPVALREKVAFAPEQLAEALQAVKTTTDLKEIAILSTCNRTELYCAVKARDADPITQWLCEYHDLALPDLQSSFYTHWDGDAVSHLMRVAVGLDSMVLGEPQILGQLKTAFTTAQSAGTLGPLLHRLSQRTYSVAKKVRTDTAIGENPVSVAYAAATLASQIFADITTCQALFIGAGETIELVSQYLINAGLKDLVVANRTLDRALELTSRIGGKATGLSEIPTHLPDTDILISSTASQLPLLGKGAVESALKLRRHKPIFMVDLAVPRDIEPEVGGLADVYLYSVDDLQKIVSENMRNREDAAIEAESLISVGATEFAHEYKSLGAVDTLVKFRQKYDRLKDEELDKALHQLDEGGDPGAVLKQLANRLTNKIIHTPSIQLKKAGAEGRIELLDSAQELFDLEDDQTDS
jgi:glutamyl-tRNA reductase|tara:strand:+ start:5776 stop:7044 length:1269 start_codon:yes stop_codon:yes gene_type:complete